VCLTQVQEPQLIEVGATGMHGCKDTNFPIYMYISVCRNLHMYITATPKAEEEMVGG
jgi:hypothetical protein